ncbi:unnamed protein product [Moneuplotes crassus]|uniref:Uncharacterized protein n=1 Tax=Euplotes crassus TaxID=5936 RepID=A0AAD1UKN1_EUPCR|nr:unnamed protein product [Moneuplotes crassus]
MRKLRKDKLEDIGNITLCGVQRRNKNDHNLLDKVFPDRVNRFCIAARFLAFPNISVYFKCMDRLSFKVLCEMCFYQFFINKFQLKRLISSFKHVCFLEMQACKLSVPKVPDFSKALENTKIQELSLFESGSVYASDWANNFNQFENLIKGFSTSPDLRISLKQLDIENCCLKSDETLSILKENRFDQILIILD